MCKCLELIRKFREGNRVMVEADCHRTVLLRRKEEEEPLCKIEIKDKKERLLVDVLAIFGAAWILCRVTRAISRRLR